MPKPVAKARRTRATKPKSKKSGGLTPEIAATGQGATEIRSGKAVGMKRGGHALQPTPTGFVDSWNTANADPATYEKAPKAFSGQPPRIDGTIEGINISQLNEMMLCPWRWHLTNRRKVARRSVVPAPDLGSIVHAGIKAAFEFQAGFGDDFEIDNSRWNGILQAVLGGVRSWRKEWIKEHLGENAMSTEISDTLDRLQVEGNLIAADAVDELDLERWEILRVKLPIGWKKPLYLIEQKITIPFLPGIPFYGTPDVVAKDRIDGGNWVMDYKVRKQFQAVESEEVDLQLPGYQYMLAKLGIPTVGSIKFQIRNKLPEIPELTKKGTMSRQRITTTWPIYKDALIANGLNPKDYEQEMKQKLDAEFFRLDRLYRNQFEITSFWDNIIAPLGKQLVQSEEFIRHMHSFHCRGCWARDLCLAELRGEDNSFLLETQYYDATAPKPKLAMRPEDFNFEED